MQPLQKLEINAFVWKMDCSDLSMMEYREKLAIVDNCILYMYQRDRKNLEKKQLVVHIYQASNFVLAWRTFNLSKRTIKYIPNNTTSMTKASFCKVI